jgi:hypothetical protein
VEIGSRSGLGNSEREQKLGEFLTKGVTLGTRSGYAGDWREWVSFIEKERGSEGGKDVYLDLAKNDMERAAVLALFFKERYDSDGMRGRDATSGSAGVRHYFVAALRPVGWFESEIVKNARAAGKMSCDELREHQKCVMGKEKLPVSEDMLMAARGRLWEGKGWGWGWGDIDLRMTYMGLMWGFELVARVGQYTAAEKGAEDHCVRLWQLSFVVAAAEGQPERVVGGGRFAQEYRDNPQCVVLACEVEASSQKGGALDRSKKKIVARRSDQESQWLDDLVAWVTRAGLDAEDLILTRSSAKHPGGRVTKKRLTAAMIREAVKDMAIVSGLPPELN